MSNKVKETQVKNAKAIAIVFMLGAFIGLFSETALNMALTNIMKDFAVNEAIVQWLTTGYLLTLGILVPVSALLIKWFTTRQLVITSFLLSMIGSIVAATAPEFSILMIGRIIQAAGTGILLPLMMNVILLIFPIHKRGSVMGFMGLVITTAPAVGPTIAGLIVEAFSWHYIFWLALILYILIFILGIKHIENVSTITKPKIDVLSIILSTLGFGGLIYSLSSIAEKTISNPMVYAPLIIGIISITIFIMRQLTMKIPMINLRVFKFPMFSLGVVQIFMGMMLILAPAILLPLYLKGSLLYGSAVAGLILLPGSAMNAILSPIVGRNFDKVGPKLLMPIGFTLTLIGSIFYILTITDHAPLWQIIGSNMIYYAGISFIVMPAQTNGLNQIPREVYSDGSAVMNTLQQIAGAIGTAAAITIMIQGQKMFMQNNPGGNSLEALAAGTHFAFYFIAGIALLGLISTIFVKRVKV